MGRTRAAIYCRRSQTGGRSVERQEHDGRRIAAERGWDVAEVFNEWVSASEFSKRARKEWERLLSGIEAGEFDAVIFYMEDRSSRHILAAAEFVKVCQDAGVSQLVLPSYEYDLADPEDVARFYGEVLAAQREVAKMSRRMRRVRHEELENGQPNPGGRRAFGSQGWRRVRDSDGNWHTKHIVSPAQAQRERELIGEAARRIVAGDSLRSIVGDWNRKKILTTTGRRWGTRTLRQVLLAPRLAGLRGHGRDEVVAGDDGQPVRLLGDDGQPVAPVLDREQWEAVRAILTDPARQATAVGRAPSYLLTGLARCGVCGARLRGIRRKGHESYGCPDAADGGRRCVERRAEPVEDLILAALFDAVESPAWNDQAAKRPTEDPTRPHYEALARLTGDLDVLDGMLTEAEITERQGGKAEPSAAMIRRKLADRETERDHHQAAVRRLQNGRVAAAVPRNLRQVWPKLSLDRQRAILAAVIERVEIHRQGTRVFDPAAVNVIWRA
jgi:site-specific DNA recombinase